MSRRILHADDGTALPVEVHGRGTPVLVLHGWTSRPEDWQGLLRRDHGSIAWYAWRARPHAGPEPTVERMARDLHQVLERLHLDRPTVIGHSMGALVLWEYIAHHGSQALGRICIIDQSPRILTDAHWQLGLYGDFDADANRRFIAELERDFAGTVMELVDRGRPASWLFKGRADPWMAARRAYLESLEPEPWIRAWESLSVKDYRDVLGRIHVPAMLVYGGEARLYPTATAHYVRSHIPAARLSIYEGTGHSPHLERLERFLAELKAFIGI